jgi:hypothetical protein
VIKAESGYNNPMVTAILLKRLYIITLGPEKVEDNPNAVLRAGINGENAELEFESEYLGGKNILKGCN